jgi:hypothetical protein
MDQGFCMKNLKKNVWVKRGTGEMSQKGLSSTLKSRVVLTRQVSRLDAHTRGASSLAVTHRLDRICYLPDTNPQL